MDNAYQPLKPLVPIIHQHLQFELKPGPVEMSVNNF